MHETIEIIDDDPLEARPSSVQHVQNLRTTHEMPCSTKSSWSQRSLSNARPPTARKSGSPQPSAFKTTHELVEPRRKKNRGPGGVESQSTYHFHQGPQGMFSQGGALEVQDDGSVDQPEARKQILDHFQQGVSNDFPEADRQSPRNHSPQTTSHHFPPKARINESTAEAKYQMTVLGDKSHRNYKHLRNQFRRAQEATVEFKNNSIDSSEDELTRDTKKPELGNAPSSRVIRTANNDVKRNNDGRIPMDSKGWSLKYARTYDFEHWGPDLFLRCGKGVKSYRVVGKDAEGNLRTLHDGFSFDHVNKLLTDNKSRIRLEGPRQPDGNLFVYDLEFTNFKDFTFFFGNVAEPECQRTYLKDEYVC